MSKDIYLTDGQYRKAMENLRFDVEQRRIKLDGFDDTTAGDKDTQCTWGLCGDSATVYPTADMHLWPEELPGRLAPKYTQEHHRCPFEDPTARDQESGCFHRCRFFKGKQRPSVAVWLQWHKEALTWAFKKNGKGVAK